MFARSRAPLNARYDFSWETLRSFLEGVSPIDLSRLALRDLDEARAFLRHYGYDLNDPEERIEVEGVYLESIAYLKRHLCPAPREGDRALTFPKELEGLDEASTLLVIASQDPEDQPLQPWACAVLRVMHTISHANHALRSHYYSEIKRQILDRYRQHLNEDSTGHLFLGEGLLAVPLEGIFFREEKSRDSLILKLLHKPDNVAQSVYDRIGVKIVTPTKVDALLALKFIRKNNLAIFANVTPGRSRNTLVDLKQFRSAYESLTVTQGVPEEDQLDLAFVRCVHTPDHEEEVETGVALNPHSSPAFRSIQFTCRQLIKVENPSHNVAHRIRTYLRNTMPGPELEELLLELEGPAHEREQRFFFPYEVQIMDLENHLRTESGESSHANYRLRQLRTARARVLGGLLRS